VALIEIDIEKKVNSCSLESHKRFGSVAPDGWSDSDSNSDFENDPGAANKKRLSLRRDSKHFKLAKPKEIDELKQPNPPLSTKRNTNWAVKIYKLYCLMQCLLFQCTVLDCRLYMYMCKRRRKRMAQQCCRR